VDSDKWFFQRRSPPAEEYKKGRIDLIQPLA
jgi:hypothetical protein